MTRSRAVTRFLGNYILGLVFALIVGSTCAFGQTLTTIYNFGSSEHDGEDPQSGVVFDKAGNLVGLTSLGGISGNGIVFQLSPPDGGGDDSWTETVIHRFHGPDGITPECRPLINNADGKILATTSRGGTTDSGTAVMFVPPAVSGDPWTGRVLYNFGSFNGDGITPNAGLLSSHGKFYGVTMNGGANRRGTVFQLSPSANPGDPWTERILHSFMPNGDAAFPLSELVMDKSGNLYGTTVQGGANNVGALYQVSPPSTPGGDWTETVIHSFNGTDGTAPAGRLLIAADGTMYGTASGGGTNPNQSGTVFKLTPPAAPGDPWVLTTLYNFTGGRDGGSPEAGVVMDKQGRLLGGASTGGRGGPDFGGVLFVLTPPTTPGDPWTERALVSFGGPNGFRPIAPLILRKEGIYGTAAQGGRFGTGTVFVLTP